MAIRLYVTDSLSIDSVVVLSKKHSHYVINVMRADSLDNIVVFNGIDGEWLAEVVDFSSSKTRLIIKTLLRNQVSTEKVTLCFCPVKGTSLNNIIRQATEMGATTILPIISQFTVVRKVNLEKFRSWVIEAAEQCYRLDIPEVLSEINFFDINNLETSNKHFILCDITMKHAQYKKKYDKENFIIVGPEGGFSNNELKYARGFCESVSLGSRVLRSDTAVVCALTMFHNSF